MRGVVVLVLGGSFDDSAGSRGEYSWMKSSGGDLGRPADGERANCGDMRVVGDISGG